MANRTVHNLTGPLFHGQWEVDTSSWAAHLDTINGDGRPTSALFKLQELALSLLAEWTSFRPDPLLSPVFLSDLSVFPAFAMAGSLSVLRRLYLSIYNWTVFVGWWNQYPFCILLRSSHILHFFILKQLPLNCSAFQFYRVHYTQVSGAGSGSQDSKGRGPWASVQCCRAAAPARSDRRCVGGFLRYHPSLGLNRNLIEFMSSLVTKLLHCLSLHRSANWSLEQIIHGLVG